MSRTAFTAAGYCGYLVFRSHSKLYIYRLNEKIYEVTKVIMLPTKMQYTEMLSLSEQDIFKEYLFFKE